MAVEGLNLYRCFVKVFGSSSNSQTFLLKSSAFAWGIPLILTVATAASKSNYLGPEFKDESQICVVHGFPFYFGLLMRVCVVMASNTLILAFVLRSLNSSSEVNNKIRKKKTAKIAFVCSLLLGSTY
nr:adhesion G-protein coupled receptor D1-like isoform X1 [Hydra vulgaris]XP_047142054.1 adhesion G-protein coupled receptor D1-like isoform X1 [Hydra vulgaris]